MGAKSQCRYRGKMNMARVTGWDSRDRWNLELGRKDQAIDTYLSH